MPNAQLPITNPQLVIAQSELSFNFVKFRYAIYFIEESMLIVDS